MAAPRDWDAGVYDRVSAPQLQWGGEVVQRLGLTGDETVLDAGCGSGRVTELLVERLPRGRVIAVDGSASMVRLAADRLGAGVELIHSDLRDLEPVDRVDVVFSTATFHWIDDHAPLFERIHSWLRPGGRLEAQCGGEGNIARFLRIAERIGASEPFAGHLDRIDGLWNFAAPAETERLLTAAGFDPASCWLEGRETRPPSPREFARTVCLGPHLEALPEDLRPQFLDAVLAAWGPDPVLDYVRLNISAGRGSDSPARGLAGPRG